MDLEKTFGLRATKHDIPMTMEPHHLEYLVAIYDPMNGGRIREFAYAVATG